MENDDEPATKIESDGVGAKQEPIDTTVEDQDLLKGWKHQGSVQLPNFSKFLVRAGAITHYIEHPISIEPAHKKREVKPMPVMLTKQVRANTTHTLICVSYCTVWFWC
jgi:hypothetical protein